MKDNQVLDQLRNGDSRGLEYLFNKHYQTLVGTAVYLTFDKDIAEDLSQEVFVKLWEKRNHLPNELNFKGYLIRMVKNSALDYLSKVKLTESGLEQFLHITESGGEISIERQAEIKQKISDAIAVLPPKCRLIFSMNRFEGLTNDEIATYLEISKRTVETQISKALRILRTELKTLWDQGLMLWLW